MILKGHILRSAGAFLGARVKSTTYIRKWLILGTAIGIIAGLGAVVFYTALGLATHLFLGILGGYNVPTPIGEGNFGGSVGFARPWIIPLVVGLGGLLSGIIVFSVAPEAEGHGTDAAIEAVHNNPRGIRTRAVIVKIIASAITIGSGGSGGREGPTAQISAGFGSLLSRILDLSPEDGKVAVSIGIGSGIGAIFGAPLGGAILSADIIYRDDFEVSALIPGLIASIIAYTVFGLLTTFSPLFGYVDRSYQFSDPLRLVWYGLIGVASGFMGLLYAKGFYGTIRIFHRLPGSKMLKPAVGGLLVGLIALVIPQVLGTGYGWIQKSLGYHLLSIPLWIVLLLPFARILATSLSIGSGGSGGIFGPGMVIGAFTGASIWRLLEPIAPSVPHNPAPFVIVGMMACFGSISRAPLAVMIMVAEMTGSLAVIPPAMIAVGIAYLIVRRSDATIYRSQLRNKTENTASRLQFGMPLLSLIKISQAMAKPKLVLDQSQPVTQAFKDMEQAQVPGAPVIDPAGQFVGTIDYKALEKTIKEKPESSIGSLVDKAAPTVSIDTTLDKALEALFTSGGWVTVLDPQRQVKGIVAITDLVRGYHNALETNVDHLSKVAEDAVMIEDQIGQGSPLVGHALRDGLLPHGAIVVSIQRDGTFISTLSKTILQAGDLVSVFTPPEQANLIRHLIKEKTS